MANLPSLHSCTLCLLPSLCYDFYYEVDGEKPSKSLERLFTPSEIKTFKIENNKFLCHTCATLIRLVGGLKLTLEAALIYGGGGKYNVIQPFNSFKGKIAQQVHVTENSPITYEDEEDFLTPLSPSPSTVTRRSFSRSQSRNSRSQSVASSFYESDYNGPSRPVSSMSRYSDVSGLTDFQYENAMFVCEERVCLKVYDNLDDLREHALQCHDVQVLLNWYDNLHAKWKDKHRDSNSLKEYPCLLRNCLAEFENFSSLNTHKILDHDFVPSFKCPSGCAVKVTSKKDLQYHLKWHECEAQSNKKCFRCDRSFKTNIALRSHLRMYYSKPERSRGRRKQSDMQKFKFKEEQRRKRRKKPNVIFKTAIQSGEFLENQERSDAESNISDYISKQNLLDDDIRFILGREDSDDCVDTITDEEPTYSDIDTTVHPHVTGEDELNSLINESTNLFDNRKQLTIICLELATIIDVQSRKPFHNIDELEKIVKREETMQKRSAQSHNVDDNDLILNQNICDGSFEQNNDAVLEIDKLVEEVAEKTLPQPQTQVNIIKHTTDHVKFNQFPLNQYEEFFKERTDGKLGIDIAGPILDDNNEIVDEQYEVLDESTIVENKPPDIFQQISQEIVKDILDYTITNAMNLGDKAAEATAIVEDDDDDDDDEDRMKIVEDDDDDDDDEDRMKIVEDDDEEEDDDDDDDADDDEGRMKIVEDDDEIECPKEDFKTDFQFQESLNDVTEDVVVEVKNHQLPYLSPLASLGCVDQIRKKSNGNEKNDKINKIFDEFTKKTRQENRNSEREQLNSNSDILNNCKSVNSTDTHERQMNDDDLINIVDTAIMGSRKRKSRKDAIKHFLPKKK